MTVTSSPASANLAASRPPMAPAPTTQIFFCLGGAPSRYGLGNTWSKTLPRAPTPSITISTTLWASAMVPAPSEVPQAMMSPGISVTSLEMAATSLWGGKKHVGDRIVLPFLAVQDGLDRQLHRVDAGRDHRSEDAKCVEALGARPLFERFVLAQEIDGGDVVHAGIAEYIFSGFGLRDVEAFLADDDAEFALINDLSGVGGRTLDRPVGGPIGIRGFEKPERLFRLLELVLGRELVEIVPQADYFRRIARRQNLNFRELQPLAAWLRTGEQLASMNCDSVSFQRAEARLSTLLKTNPFCHLRPPGKGSVIRSRRHFIIVAVMSVPAIMHCIMERRDQCMSLRDHAVRPRNIANRVAPYSSKPRCYQDAVASAPIRCPTDAVFVASAMKLRAAKNSETQVKAIASGTTKAIAD